MYTLLLWLPPSASGPASDSGLGFSGLLSGKRLKPHFLSPAELPDTTQPCIKGQFDVSQTSLPSPPHTTQLLPTCHESKLLAFHSLLSSQSPQGQLFYALGPHLMSGFKTPGCQYELKTEEYSRAETWYQWEPPHHQKLWVHHS